MDRNFLYSIIITLGMINAALFIYKSREETKIPPAESWRQDDGWDIKNEESPPIQREEPETQPETPEPEQIQPEVKPQQPQKKFFFQWGRGRGSCPGGCR